MSEEHAIPSNLAERLLRLELAQEDRDDEPVRGRTRRRRRGQRKEKLSGRSTTVGDSTELTEAGPFTLRISLQQQLTMEGWVLVSPCDGFVEHISFGEYPLGLSEPMPLDIFKSKLVSSNWRGTELPSGVDIIVKGTLKAPGHVNISVWGRVPDQPTMEHSEAQFRVDPDSA